MANGELLTRWTVRLALILYALALALRWSARGRLARMAWTAGCLAFVLHVLCAFHFSHHWSHADAHAVTAQRTADVIGWHWGGGLYANYVFTLIWLADGVSWWCGRRSYESRSRVIEWSVHIFLAFMVFNAAVVFAEGPTRWVSLGVCLLLLAFRGWLALRHRLLGRSTPSGSGRPIAR